MSVLLEHVDLQQFFFLLTLKESDYSRISANVGDHPCLLTFITMIPINCKITIFLMIACLQ